MNIYTKTSFKNTEIGEIPQDWKVSKLSDLIEIIGGGTPKTTEAEYWDGDIPWLSVVDFNDENRFVYKTEKTISEKGLKNSSTKILKKGQIIISARGTVGALAQLGLDMAFNQSCYGISGKNISNDFLYYCIKNSINRIKQNVHGAVFDTITKETFDSLLVGYPDNEKEQNQIVSILSSLDDKIELNQKTIKTLEEIGQTLFKRWFIDFEFPNEKGEPYKSSGGEMVDSELGEISKGWSVKKISDFGKVICGKTPSKDRDEYFNGDTPFIKIPDMHGNMFITETTDSLTKLGADSQSLKYLPKNSICISCIATVGLVSLTSKESQTNQQINSLILNEEYYKEYLFFTLKNSYDFLNNLASGGSATLNMNTQTFSNIEILKPNKEILLSFHENLSPIFEKILNLQNENISIKNTRDSLLPKLLSGKIRV